MLERLPHFMRPAMFKKPLLLSLLCLLLQPSVHAAPFSLQAQDTARYALATYPEALIASLAKMVSFNTVADPAVPFADNPQHTGFKRYLVAEAQRLGFDGADWNRSVPVPFACAAWTGLRGPRRARLTAIVIRPSAAARKCW
jgi:hypothetical protein